MKKKDLIKLALIGLTSTTCLVAQQTGDLDQTLAMGGKPNKCSGRRGCKGGRGKCSGSKRDGRRNVNRGYGARVQDDTYDTNGKCTGSDCYDEEDNGCYDGNCKNNCNSKKSCRMNKKDKNTCKGNGKSACSGSGGCSGSNSNGNSNNRQKDVNTQKRYNSSY